MNKNDRCGYNISDFYSEEWKLKMEASKIKNIVETGYGYTNKRISSKRLLMLMNRLTEIEAILNNNDKNNE